MMEMDFEYEILEDVPNFMTIIVGTFVDKGN